MNLNSNIIDNLKFVAKLSSNYNTKYKKKIKNEYINKLKNQIISEVRPSKIHGVGLFALKNIKKNTLMFKKLDRKDKKFSEKYLEKFLSETEIKYIDKMFDWHKDGPCLPKNINLIPITSFINHSDNPNIYYNKLDNSWYSTQDINKDDEIFSDYKLTNYGDEFL